MNGGTCELADVVRLAGERFRSRYGGSTSPQQHRVLRDVARCRTAELGGHVLHCRDCQFEQVAYNSCRNRHCPKCLASARGQWTEARIGELLPVPYFHVVFTLPADLAPLALQNERVVYDVLFRTATETLKEIAADPRHLGAEIGVLAVLHTWGQNLMHHPHVHCVVPGGGPAPDGSRWVPCRADFFLPVRVLSRVFRGKFVAGLKRAFGRGELAFHGGLSHLADPRRFNRLLTTAVRNDWVVYAKPPFGGPTQVLKYLARYTHRVAITNSRILECDAHDVTFVSKDYAADGRRRVQTIDAVEFLRRFLLHTLPKGFQRIRHYGFLANRHRHSMLAECRRLLAVSDASEQEDASCDAKGDATQPCPNCGSLRVEGFRLSPTAVRAVVPRPDFLEARAAVSIVYDTS